MTTAGDNSIYADTAQARATDKREESRRGDRWHFTDEEISERLTAKRARDAEEARRSRARIQGALSQLDQFFGRPVTPEQTTANIESGVPSAPRPDHENSKSIAA